MGRWRPGIGAAVRGDDERGLPWSFARRGGRRARRGELAARLRSCARDGLRAVGDWAGSVLAASRSGAPGVPDSRGWRAPSFVATLVLRTASPTNEEDAHGQVHRHRRSRQKLYPRRGRRQRQAGRPACRRDQRSQLDRVPADDSRGAAPVHGGRHAERLVARDPVASRSGAGGDDGQRQSRSQERRARCIRVGGEAARWVRWTGACSRTSARSGDCASSAVPT